MRRRRLRRTRGQLREDWIIYIMGAIAAAMIIVGLIYAVLPAHGEEVPLPQPRPSYERGSDAHLREVIHAALDDALHDQVKLLFSVWIKQGGDPNSQEVKRSATGIRRAVAAYRHAIRAIETEKLSWNQRNVR